MVSERWTEGKLSDGKRRFRFLARSGHWKAEAVELLAGDVGLDVFCGARIVHSRRFKTIESAQLAAESWLRERAREILEAVGEEQR
jgi:hypothetical protein